MQKIVLKEKVVFLQLVLMSQEIVDLILKMRGTGNGDEFNKTRDLLMQNVIKSKSNFDNLVQSDNDMKIISDAIIEDIYSEKSISEFFAIISNIQIGNKSNMITNLDFIDFLVFHKALISSKNILLATIQESQDKDDVIIFTIVSEGEPSINQIIEVLTKMQELINIFEKIYGDQNENRIYILDKGSNTNVGIETGINTAKSLFGIFKEIWDWKVNRKHYQAKLRNTELLENLEIISKIKQMEKDGELNEEEAQRYKALMVARTEELLSLNTIPRQLLLENNKEDKQQQLLAYNEVRLLESGKSTADNE